MKKRLPLIFSALIVIALAIVGVSYLLSFHKVSFSLDQEVSSVIIYSKDKKEIGRQSANGHKLLQEGSYYVIPEGDKLAKDRIEFTVKKADLTVEIKPAYSREYLETLFNQEESAIQKAVAAKYPTLINDFTLSQGKLYERGEWFGGLLKPKVDDIRDQKSPYRVVLNKKDDRWVVIRRPEYVLTASRYQDVPINILRDINAIVGEPGN